MSVKEINSETLADWMQKGENFKLIDIRTHGEMQAGMIPGGFPQPMASLPHALDRYQREETIVVYCRSGIRSYQVADFMQQQGYTNVINLGGGIMDWAGKGFSVDQPSAAELQACYS